MGQKLLAGKTILLVDDEEELRALLAFEVEWQGGKALHAAGGREAYELALREPVDALISDVRMPKGDGIELLDRLRKRDATRPAVLLLTGFSDLSEVEARQRGAIGVFSKPYDMSLLMQALHRGLVAQEAAQSSMATVSEC